MKVKVEMIIESNIEVEIPDTVKRNIDSIENYLLDNYILFNEPFEGKTSVTFEGISIIKN